jgi:hypothetical protein
MWRSLTIATVLLLTGHVSADVIPPGSKSISHFARFENLADYADYIFFVAHNPRGRHFQDGTKEGSFPINAQRLDPAGATVGLSRNPIDGSLYLLAVPAKLVGENGQAMSDWFDGKTPGVLQVSIGTGYRSTPESDKRKELWTHFRVDIQSGQMTVSKTREDKPGDGKGQEDPAGTPSGDSARWYIAGGLGLFAVALLIGWMVYLRRK